MNSLEEKIRAFTEKNNIIIDEIGDFDYISDKPVNLKMQNFFEEISFRVDFIVNDRLWNIVVEYKGDDKFDYYEESSCGMDEDKDYDAILKVNNNITREELISYICNYVSDQKINLPSNKILEQLNKIKMEADNV